MPKKHIDFYLMIAVILLSIFGIIMIYSSSSVWAEYKYGDAYKYLKSQSFFFLTGLLLMYIAMNIPYKYYYKKANIFIGVCFLLLVLVLIPGIGTVRNGSRSWFGIGSFGIQPTEFMKIALIIFVSKYLSKNYKDMNSFVKGLLPIILVIFLVFGLTMLQPDFGTAVVTLMAIMGLLFVGGADFNFFIKLGFLGCFGLSGLIIVAPYRLARILSFLNPWQDPLGSGFQIIQSLYSIGPGGLLGLGFGNSVQKHFYLPEPQTDFIFSIISEEFGFLGILIVASFFLFIIYRGIRVAIRQNDLFGKYIAFGIIFLIAFQSALNLMVVVGLIPVTGVTLPFLSYGGSSLLVSMASIGIILNISKTG